jgi:adenylate cyclase class IV
MGYKNREKEIKVVLDGANSLSVVDRRLRAILGGRVRRIIQGKSQDTYFVPPAGAKADFLRLRRANHDDVAKFTIKFTDRGDNFDRVEKDCDIGDFDQMLSILRDLHGEPAGHIDKRYCVLFLGTAGGEKDTTVSLYKVVNDPRIFLEIEAKSAESVTYWHDRIAKGLPYGQTRIRKSLFDIFINHNLKSRKT